MGGCVAARGAAERRGQRAEAAAGLQRRGGEMPCQTGNAAARVLQVLWGETDICVTITIIQRGYLTIWNIFMVAQ